MIRALLTGTLYADPQRRTSANGKPFTTGKLRADASDGAQVWCSLIAFGEQGERLATLKAGAKLSYAPPQPNIWIRRRGFGFDFFIEEPRNSAASRNRDADRVAAFLADELHHGRRYTANTLEQTGALKLPRARIRAALAALETNGRLEERDLPEELRRGRRKTYLHPYSAKPNGGIEPENPPTEDAANPNPPPFIIPPPYREWRNGGIDAIPQSPASLNPPKDDGGIAAEWRNSENGDFEATQTVPNLETAAPTPVEGIADASSIPPAKFDPSAEWRNSETVPVGENLPAALLTDSTSLCEILKHYRGSETTQRLASKLGWNESRVMGAAMELQRQGLATVRGGLVAPVMEASP